MTRPALLVVAEDPTPPYEQVRRQVVALVLSGRLRPGDRLPPVRQLASDLGLAAGTVARAYRELEAGGVVVTRRAAGTRVAARPAQSDPAALVEAARSYLEQARALGATTEQALAAVQQAVEPVAQRRS